MRQLLIQLALFRSLAFFIKDSVNAEEGTPNISSSEANVRLESDPEFAIAAAKKLKERIEKFLLDAESAAEETSTTNAADATQGGSPAQPEQSVAPAEETTPGPAPAT